MRIIIFGDAPGISQLLKHLPESSICGFVIAKIRLTEFASDLRPISHNILIQPLPGDEEYSAFVANFKSLDPDLILVNSYSMIIREDILSVPRFGGLNLHGALLPRNRGPHPEQWAIINGDRELGVTLHELAPTMDSGNIVDSVRVPLYIDDTWKSVRARLFKAGDILIKRNLQKILSGDWGSYLQNEHEATINPRRYPSDGKLDYSMSVISIYNHIRALLPPMPPAFFLENDQEKYVQQFCSIWEVVNWKYGWGGGMLEGKLVRLRPLQKSDENLLYEWINHRETRLKSSAYYPISEQDHHEWMAKMMRKSIDRVIFVIEKIVVSETVGICQLSNINLYNRSGELQIRIGSSSSRGKGYGSEVVNLLTYFAFNDLGLHRVYLQVQENNSEAIRAYEKCGFCKEGVLIDADYIDGNYVNLIVMSKICSNMQEKVANVE